MREIVFEVCAETVDACVAAQAGGADRIELCSALSEGGITPSHGLINSAMSHCTLPIHVMMRPRGGDYLYSSPEIEIMGEDILHVKSLGAAGVVVGILNVDRSVDIALTRRMVELAHPMEVTFHRAFDNTPSLGLALEDVIATGCHRILTSGGEVDVIAGADSLAALVKQAAGRIEIAIGGGLRRADADRLVRLTGGRHFHASMRQPEPETQYQIFAGDGTEPRYVVRADAIRSMVEMLRGGDFPSHPTANET